jgi:Zn finger protein HypA/HybF involved in hydrogenase expression
LEDKFINPGRATGIFLKVGLQIGIMELKNIREEKAVDTLIAHLKEGGYRKAKIVLGELRGNPEEFRKLFDYLTEGSSLGKTKLNIKPVKARVRCLSCDWKGDPGIKDNHVECPRCRSEVEILSGHELKMQF